MITHNGIEIDRAARTISIRGRKNYFLAHHQVSFKAIEALLLVGPVGLTREEIYTVTHGDCPEGGTIGGPHDVHVWLGQSFLPTLTALGVKVRRYKDASINRVRYSLHVV